MGANQSRPSQSRLSARTTDAAIDAKLLERLQTLRLKEDPALAEKDSYVMVGDEDPPSYTPLVRRGQAMSTDRVAEWERELMEDPKNRLALAALSSNSADAVLSSQSAVISDAQKFNIKIPLEGSPITNQASSGRCWLFASTNVFRVAIAKKYNLSEFQLSQAYLFYWDKIEKANYFLETILETASEEVDSRLVQALLASPVGDGGQWDMVANLVNKYGLVPHSLYPDSFNASSSSTMVRLITTKLREDALRLRSIVNSRASPEAKRAAINSRKEKMLKEVHLILTLMLGPPPQPDQSFTWEYYDKEGTLCTLKTTPTAFAHELSDSKTVRALAGTDIHQLFSLVNDPRNAYNTLLSVKNLGNIYGGRPVTYVNVDMKTIKDACIATLKHGVPIFFGSDVGKYSDSSRGIMDTSLYDYELGFNIKLGLSKAERLQTGESLMTHAMVLTAVHVIDGKPVRWRVENSWGERAGDKGYFVMSDEWMDEFVYQAVVDPSVVSADVRKVLGQKPKLLDLWDPMGALA